LRTARASRIAGTQLDATQRDSPPIARNLDNLLQAAPQQKAALATLAAFAATVLLTAAPAQADVKSTVCASNATAKICLKDSFKK